jgi:hypothetical protein
MKRDGFGHQATVNGLRTHQNGRVPHRRPQWLGELDATLDERHTFDPAGTWKSIATAKHLLRFSE